MTVYFIKPVGMTGPIKIGCSQSPDNRRRSLANWSPFALEIIAEIDGDTEIERRFHAKHIAAHQRREWFEATASLLADIAAVRAGTFDVATLPPPVFVTGNKVSTVRQSQEYRTALSYALRVSAMGRRAGVSFPGCTHQLTTRIKAGDDTARGPLDAFLRDPLGVGVHIKAPWAAQRRAEFASKHHAPAGQAVGA